MTNIDQAKALFLNGQFTCVLCNKNIVYTSRLKGVSPMVAFITNGIDLKGFSVADKIVGKAAAMLFALAGITEVYAKVISVQAIEVLEKYHIIFSYDILSTGITNRMGTGNCPMEDAVRDIEDLSKAFEAINIKLKHLKSE